MNDRQALEYLKDELLFIFNVRFKYFDFSMFSLLKDKLRPLLKNTSFEKEIKELLSVLEVHKKSFLENKVFTKKEQKRIILLNACKATYEALKHKLKA
ncbi:hypothetical protein [Campylobacter coli]|uniref:hypothetical protein n=1 Tax=Campylobacter coli TaxID=195 RepID=UPI00093202EF|nr:hypothetical protein [Campylobacter coli]EAK8640029.1 hypothetical protein [Campylobacter coli]ECR2482150.1 hypothetical protein [Campylobacter coli]ECR3483457.1 hypothetical protein [Campylobacter coli]EDO9024763.1 hypothetical protein [Campylobacter coli]EJK6728285.1 hypothetical protein [Campylobacter coli]